MSENNYEASDAISFFGSIVSYLLYLLPCKDVAERAGAADARQGRGEHRATP